MFSLSSFHAVITMGTESLTEIWIHRNQKLYHTLGVESWDSRPGEMSEQTGLTAHRRAKSTELETRDPDFPRDRMFTPPESWCLPPMGRCMELGCWFTPHPGTDRILLTSLHLPQGLCHHGAAMAQKAVSLLSLSTRLAAVGPRLAHNSAESLAYEVLKMQEAETRKAPPGRT